MFILAEVKIEPISVLFSGNIGFNNIYLVLILIVGVFDYGISIWNTVNIALVF